jgi:uncharacterized protein
VKPEAFWDASALTPLCIEFQATEKIDRLFQEFEIVVWWGSAVEVRSALARLERMGQITAKEVDDSLVRFADLKHRWQAIEPSNALRDLAEELPSRFNLRAADALQLAAAWIWTMQRPNNRPFLSGDQRLLEAARQMGFRAIAL